MAAIEAAKKVPQAPGSDAAVADELVWIQESFDLAKRYAYASPVGNGNGPYALTDGYEVAAGRIAQQRIALAGARLANLLNKAFK
jgi:hypothetical protein